MNRSLLIASLFLLLPACTNGDTPKSFENTAHIATTTAADSVSKQPTGDNCDKARLDTMHRIGSKGCVMQTSRGAVNVAFSQDGTINYLEGIDSLDGRSRRVTFDNESNFAPIVFAVRTTVWETDPNGGHATQTDQQATTMTDSRGRKYYFVQSILLSTELEHRHTGITRKTGANADQCDIWWKSAEGSAMTALVEHSDGASKKYQAWWNGRSSFPLKCGRFTGETDLSHFKEAFERFEPVGDIIKYLGESYAKVKANYAPAQQGFTGNVRPSVFEAVHNAHVILKGYAAPGAGTIMEGEGVDTTNPAGQFFWDAVQAVGAGFVAGAGAGVAASEGGPVVAGLAGAGAATWMTSAMMMKALINQLRIRDQLEKDKAAQEMKDKAGGPNSDNDPDTDGDGIPDRIDPDADGDGVPDDQQTGPGDEMLAFAGGDGADEGAVDTDGFPDPSGGTWNDGDGFSPPTNPWDPGDPWCPTADCDRDPSMPSGIASRPFPAL